jgi:hypothetical protein
VAYATGADAPGEDSSRAALVRAAAIVVRGESHPILCTPYPEGVPRELPDDHVRGAVHPDLEDGAAALGALVRELVGGRPRLGCDEVTHPMHRALGDVTLVPASAVLGPASTRMARSIGMRWSSFDVFLRYSSWIRDLPG